MYDVNVNGSDNQDQATTDATSDRKWPDSLLAIGNVADRVSETPVGIALTFSFVCICTGIAVWRMHPRVAFYSSVAELIPVLLLVTIVQAGYFRGFDHKDRFRIHMSRWILSIMLVGEGSALACVASGSDPFLLRMFVFNGLLWIGMLIYFYATDGPRKSPPERDNLIAAAKRVRECTVVADERMS
jgi:hypothetical protein